MSRSGYHTTLALASVRKENNMRLKHFLDIAVMCPGTDLLLDNTKGFSPGDHIVIQTKVDGANTSIRYDKDNHTLVCFSRKHELSFDNTLRGFWNYVQQLDVTKFQPYPQYVFFGEWMVSHKIEYQPQFQNTWILYDIYDTENQQYLMQQDVRKLADELSVSYIHVLYDGEFISWDHCKSFLSEKYYSTDVEEGIVCKNQSKVHDRDSRYPFVLKIVNEQFAETRLRRKRILTQLKRKLELTLYGLRTRL